MVAGEFGVYAGEFYVDGLDARVDLGMLVALLRAVAGGKGGTDSCYGGIQGGFWSSALGPEEAIHLEWWFVCNLSVGREKSSWVGNLSRRGSSSLEGCFDQLLLIETQMFLFNWVAIPNCR